jgi:hypothetical protein
MLFLAIASCLGSIGMFVLAGSQLVLAIFALASCAICAVLSVLHRRLGGGLSIVFPVGYVVLSTAAARTLVDGDGSAYAAGFAIGLAGIAGVALEKLALSKRSPDGA